MSFRGFFLNLACLLAATLALSAAPSISGAAAATLRPYSITAADAERFSKTCHAELTSEEMRDEILGLFAQVASKADMIESLTSSTESIGRVIDFFKADKKQTRFNIVLDGLPLFNIDRANILAIAELTALDGAAGTSRHVSKLEFQNRPWITTQRFCLSENCRKRKRENGHDLRAFNQSPICQDAICASQRLFGEEQGIRILWIYLKYHAALGPFTDPFADPKGLSVETIRALSLAFRMLPEFFHPLALQGSHFYRFLRGETLPLYQGRKVYANGEGAIFDPMDSKTLYEKAAMLFHEVAHRTTLVEPLDASAAWLHISGWRMDVSAATRFEPGIWPSYYARANPFEDFAETFVMYRLRPRELFQISPRRYEYMRDRVFRGREYDVDTCNGS
jgi:hypothetical protein